MKLKPVVASLVLVGLMTPAFAKTSVITQQAVMDQNSAVTPVCSEGWFNRITVGGFGSVVGMWSNRDNGLFTKLNSGTDFVVNNVNLLINANLSSWTKATVNLAYSGAKGYDLFFAKGTSKVEKIDAYANHQVFVDEAYVTVANLAKTPFYAKFGKMYVPFADYSDAYIPIQIMSPAQMLGQINAPTAVVGVTSDFGFYANAFAFRGETRPLNSTTGNIRNWGGKIGYYDNLDQFKVSNAHVNLNVSYIHNVLDKNSISDLINRFNDEDVATKYTRDPIGGLSFHGDLSYQAFDLSANWVGMLKDFMAAKTDTYDKSQSYKFWGADVNATYAFKTLNHDSHFGASIQWSDNGQFVADAFGDDVQLAAYIPKWRVAGDYKVNLFKNTDLDLIVAHSKSYDFANEGSANSSSCNKDARTATLGLARLMVQF